MQIYKIKSIELSEDEFRSHANNFDGYCLSCKEIVSGGCEGDMENGPCEVCEENEVYGIEQMLIYGKVEII